MTPENKRKAFGSSVGIFILFVMPWTHRLAYENLRLAIPDLSSNACHGISGALGLIAAWITTQIIWDWMR